LFKLHAPRNFIVGGGVFARADILPTSLAWETFGPSNGAPSLNEMRRRIAFYRGMPDDPRQDYSIGCRVLRRRPMDTHTPFLVSAHSARPDIRCW
jgi:putative restriction endonuclease